MQEDIPAAERIQQTVLPPGHPYVYARNIEVGRTVNLVAETSDIIIGFASVLLTRWDTQGPFLWQRLAPYLAFIGVVPEHQGKGVGPLLLRQAVESAAIGCVREPMLFLEHEPENVKARKAFERTGFRVLTKNEILQLAGIEPQGPVMAIPLDSFRKSR
jgi:GNAT superfamily N-acetyltransferase